MDTKTSTPSEVTNSTNRTCLYLGMKLRPGPIQRHRLDDFSLNDTVGALKQIAGNRANLSTDSLDLIHHGRILEDLNISLAHIGVRAGEMLHVVKKSGTQSASPPTYTDSELQQIMTSLRALGCTPNAPGWTKAMQVLEDPERMEELLDAVPALEDDCMALSILHEVELLAALAASLSTMRRGAAALPSLPAALKHLGTMLKAHPPTSTDSATPTTGFAYSLEALSEDEDGDEDDEDPPAGARGAVITEAEVAAALRAARENMATRENTATANDERSPRSTTASLLQLLRNSTADTSGAPTRPWWNAETTAAEGERSPSLNLANLLPNLRNSTGNPSGVPQPGGSRNVITTDMFSNAVTEALNRSTAATSGDDPMEHNTTASSSQGGAEGRAWPNDFSSELSRMRDMGLLNDDDNLRALIVCNGDVNAAINFVFNSLFE